jgi:hypothetical protein
MDFDPYAVLMRIRGQDDSQAHPSRVDSSHLNESVSQDRIKFLEEQELRLREIINDLRKENTGLKIELLQIRKELERQDQGEGLASQRGESREEAKRRHIIARINNVTE